jgi:hypothetical protein
MTLGVDIPEKNLLRNLTSLSSLKARREIETVIKFFFLLTHYRIYSTDG